MDCSENLSQPLGIFGCTDPDSKTTGVSYRLFPAVPGWQVGVSRHALPHTPGAALQGEAVYRSEHWKHTPRHSDVPLLPAAIKSSLLVKPEVMELLSSGPYSGFPQT